MSRKNIINPEQSYTFADYFKINFAPQDILAYFNVSLERSSLELARSTNELDRLHELKKRIEEVLPRLSLTSEIARREFLIAPVLTDLLHYTEATLNIEYPIVVNHQLKGSLDYLIQNSQVFLVVEAKNEDLEKGFLQLAVELIALDQWMESNLDVLNGAVSTGNIWQVAKFNTQDRIITQDINLYRVPADLEEVLRILVKILASQ
jgi:hypothetical protein